MKGKSGKFKKSYGLSKNAKSQVKNIATRVAKGRAETKIISTQVAAQGLAAASATISDHTAILQGTTQNTRVGLSITPSTFKFKQTFTCPNNSTIRSILFQWHPDSAASFPVVGSILDVGANGVTPDHLSQYNYFNRSQYTILSDITKVCLVQNSQEIFINQMPKKKLRHISYNSGAVATGENHVFSCLITETAATNSGVTELKFQDS